MFTLPEVTGGRDWVRLIDTNLPEEDDDPEEPARFAFGHRYEVTGRSLLLFLARPARAGTADAGSALRAPHPRHRPPNDAGAGVWASQRGTTGLCGPWASSGEAARRYCWRSRPRRRRITRWPSGPNAATRREGSFVTVDGVRLHYVERGTGPAVVLLHGVGAMTQ